MAADEPTPLTDEPSQAAAGPQGYEPADLEDEEPTRRRSLWGLVPVLVAIAIIIIVLLLLRDCAGTQSPDDDGRGKTIEDISGLTPVEGVISLWIDEGADIDEVLAAAGVTAEADIDLGGGRHVLDVAAGSEKTAIAALERTPGVNDAGRVFEE